MKVKQVLSDSWLTAALDQLLPQEDKVNSSIILFYRKLVVSVYCEVSGEISHCGWLHCGRRPQDNEVRDPAILGTDVFSWTWKWVWIMFILIVCKLFIIYDFEAKLQCCWGGVLKIHFFIESGPKNIKFKTKSKIFVQKIFIQLSTENLIESFIQKNLRKINKI